MQVTSLPTPTPTPNPSPQGGGEHRQRRGACPGLSAPMPTGDGLLVRLLPIGTILLDAFSALCAAAQKCGNGIIEITARGSLQVRGLTDASAPRFADAIAALNIAAADGVPVLSNALAGLDAEEILDAGALADGLRRALARTSLFSRLAPKVSVAIDGGGALTLDGISADVRLNAELISGDVVLRVGVGGAGAGAIDLGFIAPAHGVEAAVRLLEVLARRDRDARARDVLAAEGMAPFQSALRELLITPARPRESGDPGRDSRLRGNERRTSPIGLHLLRDGSIACGVGLSFGHTDAAVLERLVEAAAGAGAIGLRAAAGRALIVIGLPDKLAPALVAETERLGFIVHAGDPRRHIAACAGAPICASAHIAARAIAPLVATAAQAHLDAAFPIHISGCAKGCAHPGVAALTIVGATDGCLLVADGSARDVPFATVAADELPAAIAKYAREEKDKHV
jgi:precorrin-3B synthase